MYNITSTLTFNSPSQVKLRKEFRMSKVELIVEPKNSLPSGELVTTEVQLPEDITIVGVIRSEFEPDYNNIVRVNDDITPVIHMQDMNNLIGKLMTQIEASTTDPEQRKATKDVFMRLTWEWYTNRVEALTRAWRFDKGYEKNELSK